MSESLCGYCFKEYAPSCCEKSEYENVKRQLAEAREIVAGMDIYIEAECHESWANNYEIRESAFVDMAKKLKQLKEQNQ